MNKFHYSTREIGGVAVFDLKGAPTFESVQEVAWKIQKNIRRHHFHQIILNFKEAGPMDTIELRRLLTVCIRPKHSVIYGASPDMAHFLEENCFSGKVDICADEKEVAESFGPFLFDKDPDKRYLDKGAKTTRESLGYQLESRRSHRMHVAIPLELRITSPQNEIVTTKAIATNISEGGMFVEYLDLESAGKITRMEPVENLPVEIHIFKSANFPDEYHVAGRIRRKEIRKEQLGLGIEFQENLQGL
ncbi:MAG TPA: PilZ domain-containing protein [Candidatus Omnitrophota bacterium]|nr:PilZ domain-containing protein [Candidatus Omnitrophota bacterium]HRY85563.1 PilZ domain-containing protein [Candidatus Omnitrophota bacterium]